MTGAVALTMELVRILLLSLALLGPHAPAAGGQQRPAALPELPEVSFEGFDSAARAGVEAAYRSLLRDPEDSLLNGRLGMRLHAYEDYHAAEACYRRAHLLDPGSFDWVYLLAVVELSLGKRADSISHLRASLELNPAYPAAGIKLGDALLAAGEVEESLQAYRAVLQKQPASWLAHYGLGRALLTRQEVEAGVQHLEKATSAPGGFGAAHYALALAYRDLGRRAEARTQLGLYREHQNRWPAAGDSLLDSVRSLKTGPREVLAQGVRLARQNHFEEAIGEHEKALQMDPSLVQAHVNLIRLYGELKQFEPAERHYRKLVELDPGQPDGHYNFGVILSSLERFQEAEEAFRKAIDLNPHFALAHNNLGYMLERLGRREEAADHYREAVRNDPTYRLARFNLGRTLVASGETEEAITELSRTLTPEDEETPRFLYALSAAYVRAGKLEEAHACAESAKQQATRWGQQGLAEAIEKDLQRLKKALGKP